jgi:hypothetical protein
MLWLQVVLDLVVVHIQEGWLYGVGADEVAAHEAALAGAVAATGCPVPLQCIPLQAALHAEQGGAQEADQLQQLKEMYQVGMQCSLHCAVYILCGMY